jgi:hypothetical protein
VALAWAYACVGDLVEERVKDLSERIGGDVESRQDNDPLSVAAAAEASAAD